MSEKKIDLIAQLLAKAESTTPEEAEALTEHAARLMTKYMIDQATIDARRAKAGKGGEEKIVQVRMDFTGAYRGEMLHLGSSVLYAMDMKAMQDTGSNKGKTFGLYLVGFESDVAQAKLLIESLQIQSTVAVRTWWKENKSAYSFMSAYDQEKQRRSFVYGFGSGAGKRVRDNRQKVVQEASTGTELVLVSRKERVQAYMDSLSTRKGRARTATGGGAAGFDGYRAGQQAHTGERGMTQGRGISA